MDRRVLDDQLLLIGRSFFFLGGCLALYYFKGTPLILLRSWCEIGLVFLREAFPTITLNSSTVNFFPNCSSLEIYFSGCCLSSIACCLTGLVCLCVGALGDLLGTILPVVVGANPRNVKDLLQ
ncbi:PREDICTED: uncharacterized protein LOC105120606 [Populus euphratica]|uniref:Uncharacterized protein LOC105120606 n=1 Tax=Populus euphratica TaxID=75702 RepID=A0AAJ6TU20_POPEU|nr:PREDICTED: uncharacterized protein LOC105120606 [Populus euphratica]